MTESLVLIGGPLDGARVDVSPGAAAIDAEHFTFAGAWIARYRIEPGRHRARYVSQRPAL